MKAEQTESRSRHIRLFQSQFARKVRARTKRQTVRKAPIREMRAGDALSCREWTGLPYRSKQRVLTEETIKSVSSIEITWYAVFIGCGEEEHEVNREEFARMDGFSCWREMVEWFERTHGLPFKGVLICW